MNTALLIFLTFLEVLLLIIDRSFEILNLKHYWDLDHYWWAALTLFFLCLPGILEAIYLVSQLEWFCGDQDVESRKFLRWMLFALTFPISIVARHVGVAVISLWRPEFIRDKYSTLRVLKSLQSFSETAPQIVLQSYIVMNTYTKIEDHWIQIACIVTNTLMLAKSCSEHHFHEVSGKTSIASLQDVAVSYVYYLLHVVPRLAAVAVVFVYYKFYAIALPVLLVAANFAIAFVCLRHNFVIKTLWTSVASALAPICFVSRHAIEVYSLSLESSPEKRFQRFYFWNNVAFALILTAVAVSLNLLSGYGVIGIAQVDLPVLTFGHQMSAEVMGVGAMACVGLATVVSLAFSWNCCLY